MFQSLKKQFQNTVFGLLSCCVPFLLLFLTTPHHIPALEVQIYNRYQTVDNLDFHSFNPGIFSEQQANPQSNSDDRYQWVTSTLSLAHRFTLPKSEIFFQAYHSFFWGADNAQDTRQNGFGLRELYIRTQGNQHILSIGRQRIQMDPFIDDFFFADIVDGLHWQFGGSHAQIDASKAAPANLARTGFTKSRVQTNILLDVLGNSIDTQDLGLFSVLPKDEEVIADFRGDTISARFGLGLKFLPSISQQSQNESGHTRFWGRLFFYGIRYGANTRGGADLSRNGLLADNQSDGDSLNIVGVRVGSDTQAPLRQSNQFTLAYSNARDRKPTDNTDSGTENWHGWAGTLQFLRTSSPRHSTRIAIGVFGVGYTGLRGASLGESVLYGPSFFAPAPYAGNYHFSGRPFTRLETSEKTFLKISNVSWGATQTDRFSTDVLFLWESHKSSYWGTEYTFRYEKWWGDLVFAIGIGVFWPDSPIHAFENPALPTVENAPQGLAPATTLTFQLNFSYEEPKPNQNAPVDPRKAKTDPFLRD